MWSSQKKTFNIFLLYNSLYCVVRQGMAGCEPVSSARNGMVNSEDCPITFECADGGTWWSSVIPAHLLLSCLSRGEFLQLCKPQFPNLKNGDNGNAGLQKYCEDQENGHNVCRWPREKLRVTEAVVKTVRIKNVVGIGTCMGWHCFGSEGGSEKAWKHYDRAPMSRTICKNELIVSSSACWILLFSQGIQYMCVWVWYLIFSDYF